MRANAIFIINPISGGKRKNNIPTVVNKYLDKSKFKPVCVFTEGSEHAGILAREALVNNYDFIIAVGGDGTINEIASVLAGTDKFMGIIPCGSGNGLARSLGIPLSHNQAVSKLNSLNSIAIDSAVLNDRKFFNMAGMGFDAHISAQFAGDKTRGLIGYIKSTFSEIQQYRSQQYRIEIDGKLYEREAFMLSIANSSQFGNNAHVAPGASLTDGWLDVCIIKPFPLHHFPVMGYHMFSKTADRSRYVEIIKGQQIFITRELPGPVHLDGEPSLMNEMITIAIKPLSLNVLI